MKEQKYIMDKNIILNLQGVRFIKKQDTVYASKYEYRLIWNYKGSDGYYDYKDKKERDRIFDEIVSYLRE